MWIQLGLVTPAAKEGVFANVFACVTPLSIAWLLFTVS